MIKVLTIEDSEETRDILKIILSEEKSIKFLEAASIKEGMEILKKETPEIILLDLSLPDGNGSYVCEQIKSNPKYFGSPFILALTAETSQETVNTTLEMGCDDYIKKPFDSKELLIRLKKFIVRVPQNKDILTYENMKLFSSDKTMLYENEPIELSKNEFELLSYFIVNRGLLLTRESILNHVWKENFDISDKAVDQCLKRLRKKLHILNEVLISKRGFGYILK